MGTTLIGIMIGLLVALMAILALMTVYRVTIDVSTNAIGTTQRDGQVAMALGAAQLELQQAGFGIERDTGAADTSLLSIDDDGRRIAWRYRATAGAADTCAGLALDADTASGGLSWLPPRTCDDAAAISPTTPAPQPLATGAAFFVPSNRSGTLLTDEVGALTFADARFALDGLCTLPFAQQTFGDDVATPQAQAVTLQRISGDTLLTACLANIVVDTLPAVSAAGTP